MPLFGRRRGVATTAAPTEANGATNGSRGRSRIGTSAYGQDSLNSRPTVGQWFKGVWVDILTMAAMGAVGLGVSSYSHVECTVY